MQKKYKLYIFDWDGTLMDSQQQIVSTLRQTIIECQLEDRTDNELKDVIGLGLHQAIAQLYPRLSEQQITHVANVYRAYFLAEDTPSAHLFDGVLEMIEQLHQSGIMLAVATGKGRRGLDKNLADSGLSRYFHASRCADETRSKPHPQMLEELLDEFALAADQALMIGDSIYDLQMAANIHMDAVAVSYGVHEVARLKQFNPLTICDNVKHLQNFLLTHSASF